MFIVLLKDSQKYFENLQLCGLANKPLAQAYSLFANNLFCETHTIQKNLTFAKFITPSFFVCLIVNFGFVSFLGCLHCLVLGYQLSLVRLYFDIFFFFAHIRNLFQNKNKKTKKETKDNYAHTNCLLVIVCSAVFKKIFTKLQNNLDVHVHFCRSY